MKSIGNLKRSPIKRANDFSNDTDSLVNIKQKFRRHFKASKVISFMSPGETFTRNPAKNIKYLSPISYLSNFKQSYKEFKKRPLITKKNKSTITKREVYLEAKTPDLGLYGRNTINQNKFKTINKLKNMLKNCTIVTKTKNKLYRLLVLNNSKLMITGITAKKCKSVPRFCFDTKHSTKSIY